MTRLAASGLLVLLLAACGGGGDGDAAPATTADSPTTEPAPAPEPTETETGAATETGPDPDAAPEGPPFRTDATAGESSGPTEGSGTSLLSDVRLASHGGFDRLVFEFRPGGVPAYQVDYVRPPITSNPGGSTMSVAGEAFLSIRMEPASSFDASGDLEQVYRGPLRLVGADAGAQIVQDVVRTEDFEAVMTWVAGLARRQPFRAFTLTGPPRLVVDVRTGG